MREGLTSTYHILFSKISIVHIWMIIKIFFFFYCNNVQKNLHQEKQAHMHPSKAEYLSSLKPVVYRKMKGPYVCLLNITADQSATTQICVQTVQTRL